MALATVIAGAYTATYAAAAMGQQEDGFRLRLMFSKEEIRSNTYGDSAIDAVYRGGNCFLSFTAIEHDSVVAKAAASPWNPYGGAMGEMGLVGRLDWALSVAVVLTAITGVPAQVSASPATLTGTNAILDQNLSNTELLMANRARYASLVFRLYPYLSTTVKWFAVT